VAAGYRTPAATLCCVYPLLATRYSLAGPLGRLYIQGSSALGPYIDGTLASAIRR
jgi:hypothetical protein